jgi:hypothetical protein
MSAYSLRLFLKVFLSVIKRKDATRPTTIDDAAAEAARQHRRNRRASKRMLARLAKFHPERMTDAYSKQRDLRARLGLGREAA